MVKFSEEEIDYITENYSETQNRDLSIRLNRSIGSILAKSRKLGLRKSKNHKSMMVSKRNKIAGRDLNEDFLAEIALKYKSRSEFQEKDPSAYTSARNYDILDKICSHMISVSFSIPQLMIKKMIESLITSCVKYNDRSRISPYEIDIFLPQFNLAFEYDGKRWHLDNKNDTIKEKLMFEAGIHLIRFKENSRKYDEDVKSQFISNLNLINYLTQSSLSDVDVACVDLRSVYSDIVNKEDIKDICSKYDEYHLFRKEQINIYNKLSRYGILNEFTSHMKRTNPLIKWDVDKCKEEISKYTILSDFITKSQGCYLFILKHKLNYLYSHLISRKKSYWSDIENIKMEISRFKKLNDFIRNSNRCYSYIIENKLHHLLNSLERNGSNRIKWNDDLLMSEISKYSNLKEFRKNSIGAYRHILRNKKKHLLVF